MTIAETAKTDPILGQEARSSVPVRASNFSAHVALTCLLSALDCT